MITSISSLKPFPFDRARIFIQTAQFFVQKQTIVLYHDWIQVSSLKMTRKLHLREPQCVSKTHIITINICNTIKLTLLSPPITITWLTLEANSTKSDTSATRRPLLASNRALKKDNCCKLKALVSDKLKRNTLTVGAYIRISIYILQRISEILTFDR